MNRREGGVIDDGEGQLFSPPKTLGNAAAAYVRLIVWCLPSRSHTGSPGAGSAAIKLNPNQPNIARVRPSYQRRRRPPDCRMGKL